MEWSGYRLVSAAQARAMIAALAEDNDPASIRLGNIDLQIHQVSAVIRLRRAIDEFGGALLCDPVGTGKTYVALAVAQPGEKVVVVAPAVLRQMWMQASSVTDRSIDFVSFESLSRRAYPGGEHALVVIDEAHHARNPRTIRYGILSRLCSGKKVLMLTATPIHNRRRDLESLLALFMGSRAGVLTSAETGRCVIRRSELSRELTAIPRAEEVVWFSTVENDRIPSALLDLPPPLPPRDGGDGGALVVHSLIRQWASSDAALTGGLRRRLVRAEALIAALHDGTWPSKSELSAWICGEDTVQLALPALLAPVNDRSRSLLSVIEQHHDALRAALALARLSNADEYRAAVIRRIRESHGDRRIVVFSQYADSVEGMFALLSRDGHVAALTGSGARVAGGSIGRHDAIGRFAPFASGAPPPRTADDVTLLITTDLLSEGVNLQDAAVVIHLDLPWTPARLEQRLGRIARLGSRYERVASFAFKPPATSETIIRVEEILERKLHAAGVVTGTLPSFHQWSARVSMSGNTPVSVEALRKVLRRWTSSGKTDRESCPVAAVVRAEESGFLAAVTSRDDVRLVGCLGDTVDDDLTHILKCTCHCMGEDSSCSPDEISRGGMMLAQWLASEGALAGARVSSVRRSSARNRAVRRIDHVVRAAPVHERHRIQHKAGQARAVVERSFGVYAESQLSNLCVAGESGEAWLDLVIAFGDGVSEPHGCSRRDYRIGAMIIFHKSHDG